MHEKSRVSSAIKYDCLKMDGSGNCIFIPHSHQKLSCLESGVSSLNSYKMSFISNSTPLLRQLNFLV